MGAKALKRMDRSLAFFVLALQGHDVVIELRNAVYLRGTVYIADIFMKCASHMCVRLY
jgi:small nuclear ribonucleoprotein (snRNP)-like protein